MEGDSTGSEQFSISVMKKSKSTQILNFSSRSTNLPYCKHNKINASPKSIYEQ